MTVDSRASGRTRAGLAVLLLPALLTSMDISVLFVAAPAIAEALDPSATEWLWMMDVYGFVLAGLLITMGGLGDRFGRRRMLLIGAVMFGTASVVIAYAPTAGALIAARALLGVGAATLAPSTLSLIRHMFADDAQRRTAVASWTVAFTGGAVAGPIIGGALLEHYWWGSVFLINVPVMLLLLAAAPVLIGEYRPPSGGGGFDLPGAAASLVAVLGPVVAVKRLTEYGPDAAGAGAFAAGLAGAALFARRQRRARHPLIDPALFRRPAFGAALSANTVIALASTGLGFLAFTFLQTVHGLGPLQAALWATPTFLGTLAGATAAGLAAARVRTGSLMTCGLLVGAAGFAGIGVFGATSLPLLIAGYTVLTFGIGIVGALANDLVLATAPADRAGAASGISETGVKLGESLGIAILGTVSAVIYRNAMGPGADPTVAAALARSRTLAEPAASDLRRAAFDAYTQGFTVAAFAGAAVLTAVALITALPLRRHTRPGRTGTPTPEPVR
ncbi:MFS transporter [Spongiactinospora gelatinilytica]|uniref:MFS transporter n=1 Tax=Spongiactinospora gelatinilytica TaxID=2666298 RepID=A0A2W2HKR7_9ACTN|nr:MFS transporter [Spongiactinospora gelatinilytica]PZG50338.1 MFS transporter [Spongiactinospora gelatinilytica]